MLRSLHRRPRGHRLARALDRTTGGLLAGRSPIRDGRDPPPSRAVAPEPIRIWPATAALWSRLDAEDKARVQERIQGHPEVAGRWASAGEFQPQFELALGLWLGIPGIAEKTGLSAAQPPVDVHAMAHEPLATGGTYYYADLVLEALDAIAAPDGPRVEIAAQEIWARVRGTGHALDFGASSGRVVRVLQAVLPDVSWHACDPNAAAVAWAREHLPGIDFQVSPEEPPLPDDDAAFDVVFAISIWSHFGPNRGRRWLDEMHRVIRPGGHLVMTVQSHQSLAYYTRTGRSASRWLRPMIDALHKSGFHLEPAFGPEGDHGVGRDSEWGMAFMSAEWLVVNATPAWAVRWWAVGRAEENQDVVVLERR